MLEKPRLKKVRDYLTKKVEIYNISYLLIIGITIGMFVLVVGSATIGYTGYLSEETILNLVEQLEEEYLYEDVLSTEEYKDLKDNLMNKKFHSKQDFQKFLYSTRDLADDKFTFFDFDDLIGTNISKKYSTNTSAEDNFEYEIQSDNLGYIRFTAFNEGTGDKFNKALEEFNEKEVKNLVIDLRRNVGGKTDELKIIADALLPEAEILRLSYKKQDIIDYSDAEHIEFDKIFVFLSNYSASCAEILPLTLKENLGDKVVLIGNETYKKGVGQNMRRIEKYRYEYYIVSHKWFVNDKDVDDLNDYLKVYSKKFDVEDTKAYFDVVYENLNV